MDKFNSNNKKKTLQICTLKTTKHFFVERKQLKDT